MYINYYILIKIIMKNILSYLSRNISEIKIVFIFWNNITTVYIKLKHTTIYKFIFFFSKPNISLFITILYTWYLNLMRTYVIKKQNLLKVFFYSNNNKKGSIYEVNYKYYMSENRKWQITWPAYSTYIS